MSSPYHDGSRSPQDRFADRDTPTPDWKRSDWASDVLPDSDPARTHDGALEA